MPLDARTAASASPATSPQATSPSTSPPSPPSAPVKPDHAAAASMTAAAWAFYECGFVCDEEDGDVDDEDSEDELETQDWIRFQRQRTLQRLQACNQAVHQRPLRTPRVETN